jgi:hypothetical protein
VGAAEATADATETTEAGEQNKPPRKRVARRPARESQNFFDFFFGQTNGSQPRSSRSNGGRSNSAQYGFRPFF